MQIPAFTSMGWAACLSARGAILGAAAGIRTVGLSLCRHGGPLGAVRTAPIAFPARRHGDSTVDTQRPQT